MIIQTDIKDKVLRGCELAIERLLEQKSKTNSYLAVSDNGKVIKIKAADLKQSTPANNHIVASEVDIAQREL